jgi:acetyl-CoA carboxylase/biotin carboxylase 1
MFKKANVPTCYIKGPLHGLPVSTPYMTKDYLETKRSKALAVETTFVYDYPDLFKVNLKEIWKGHFSMCKEKGKP